jgi:copper chaperone
LTTSTSTTYPVPGVSCDHCKHAIESEVGAVAGVARVEVDIAAKSVRVEGTAADGDVRAAIGRAGYDVAAKESR